MYLLTEWEGRREKYLAGGQGLWTERTGKYLGRGQGVRTERSEVRTSWPRAKYFPVRTDLTHSISILSYDHSLSVQNFEKYLWTHKIRRLHARGTITWKSLQQKFVIYFFASNKELTIHWKTRLTFWCEGHFVIVYLKCNTRVMWLWTLSGCFCDHLEMLFTRFLDCCSSFQVRINGLT